tara:strand:+ start:330 stop:830 length:501 start_codon:yes stop_codon:yes gene_type:complete
MKTITEMKQEKNLAFDKKNYLVNAKQYINQKPVRSVSEAIQSEAPSLANLTKKTSVDDVEKLIASFIVDINYHLNVKNPMTAEHISLASQLIYDEFYNLKLSDLYLISRRIISGQYGEFYNTLSTPKLLLIFRNYFNERCDMAADLSKSKHESFKNDLENYKIKKL